MYQTEKGANETDELLKRLVEADERYQKRIERTQAGKTLQQEKLEYDLPTDEEIAAAAEREAKRYYEEKEGKTNDRYDALGEELKAESESRRELTKERGKQVEKAYEERRKDAENQALARGLGRSSIIMGQIEEFDRGRIDDTNKLYAEYADALTEITAKLNSLEAERTAELNALEYESAGVTEESIRKLRDERDKKLAEMIKYNNAISEKQQKYADSKGGATAEQVKAIKEASDKEKYAIAKAVLDQKTAAQAFETLISDRQYQQLLGDYFPYLLNYYRKRM